MVERLLAKEKVAGSIPVSRSTEISGALEAERKSPRTVRSYGDTVRFYVAYASAKGWPTAVGEVERRHVLAWLAALHQRTKPASAATGYQGLLRFFGWAVAEGELTVNPMGGDAATLDPRDPAFCPISRRSAGTAKGV